MVRQGSNPSRSACGHRCSQLCPYKYGGMGEKKRLAKKVYHHGGVRGHFDC